MDSSPLSPAQRLAARSALRNKFIVFAGDATHRNIRLEFLGLLIHAVGLRMLGMGLPTLGGEAILDNDHQKDLDHVGDAICSLRFLRGLDLEKLRLSASDFRQRFFYPDMATDTISAFELLPLTHRTILAADASWCNLTNAPGSSMGNVGNAGAHNRAVLERASAPDVVILNSCAWDIPSINRSRHHYPLMDRPCPVEIPPTALIPLRHATLQQPRWATARVAASPCVTRGDELSDEAIYLGFVTSLREAVGLLRSSLPRARLLLRNCHTVLGERIPATSTNAPTATRATSRLHAEKGRGDAGQQGGASSYVEQQLLRMNSLIASVATEQRVQLIDVAAIDRALSLSERGEGGRKRMLDPAIQHVSRNSSAAAAMAILRTLVQV